MVSICKKLVIPNPLSKRQHSNDVNTKSKRFTPKGENMSEDHASQSALSSSYSSNKGNSLPSLNYSHNNDSTVPSSPSINTSAEAPVAHNSENFPIQLPKVPLGWDVRFDPVLGEYYYLNQINNLIQLDHPEEVLSPISRHNSFESVFLPKSKTNHSTKHNENNYALTETKQNYYTDKALSTHYLLANGTGIPILQTTPSSNKRWRQKLSILGGNKKSPISSSASIQGQNQNSINPSHLTQVADADADSIVSTIALDDQNSNAIAFYTGQVPSPHGQTSEQHDSNAGYDYFEDEYEDDDEDDEDDVDNEELELLRRKMLQEVQTCDMRKLASV